MEPEIRRLILEDKEKLKPLFRTLTGKDVIINASSLINDPNAICLVLEKDDELIGFGSLIIHKIPTKGEVGRIEDLVISENHQRNGYGEKILLALIQEAALNNISQINLTSSPLRIPAQKLYEKLGFIKGETDVFYLKCDQFK